MWDEKDQTFPHVLTSIFNSQHNYRWFCQLVVSSAFWTEASCPQQAHTRTNKKKSQKTNKRTYHLHFSFLFRKGFP